MVYTNTEKPEELLQAIGTEIAKKRCAKGWSQEQLAARVPITASKLSRIECGKVNSKMTTLIGISRALDVSLDELLGMQIADPTQFESVLSKFSDAERNVIYDILETAEASIRKYIK